GLDGDLPPVPLGYLDPCHGSSPPALPHCVLQEPLKQFPDGVICLLRLSDVRDVLPECVQLRADILGKVERPVVGRDVAARQDDAAGLMLQCHDASSRMITRSPSRMYSSVSWLSVWRRTLIVVLNSPLGSPSAVY